MFLSVASLDILSDICIAGSLYLQVHTYLGSHSSGGSKLPIRILWERYLGEIYTKWSVLRVIHTTSRERGSNPLSD
jgi:hypothetical protein